MGGIGVRRQNESLLYLYQCFIPPPLSSLFAPDENSFRPSPSHRALNKSFLSSDEKNLSLVKDR